jgi:23S rRNA (uridine2552-2'-O)-methyltransferase
MTHRNISTKVKTAKGRKLSSSLWLKRQLNDQYVARAQKEGYRSRAAYKLLEIDSKFHIFSKNTTILDLGAAPGSWSQIAIKNPASKVVALDLLPMLPIKNVEFIQDDFTNEGVIEKIKTIIGDRKIDILLSDMSPNISGHKNTDHLRIVDLCELVFEFAKENLAEHGVMVVKIFQGGTENKLLKEIKKYFKKTHHFKPESSRKESAEMYLVAMDFHKVL